jgi:hypothetical protein
MLDWRILYNHSCKTLYQDLDNELTQIVTGLKANFQQMYRIASKIDNETRVFSRLQAHHCIRYCQWLGWSNGLLYFEAVFDQRWSNFMDLKDWVHCSFFWRLSVEVVKNGIWGWSWMQFPYLWDVNLHHTIISIADMIINMWCSTSFLSTCKSPVTSLSREQLLQAKSLIETQTEGKNWYINHQYVMLHISPCLQVSSYISN